MNRANESAPGPGRSQRHVNNSSAKPTGRPGRPLAAGIPRLALSPAEAAEALGVSRDFFDEHIAPELRITRKGRRKLIAVTELGSWLASSATRTLEAD